MSDDTIILHEMVPKWNRLYKQKGEFRQIRWCKTHDCSPYYERNDECWLKEAHDSINCVIVDKWLEL